MGRRHGNLQHRRHATRLVLGSKRRRPMRVYGSTSVWLGRLAVFLQRQSSTGYNAGRWVLRVNGDRRLPVPRDTIMRLPEMNKLKRLAALMLVCVAIAAQTSFPPASPGEIGRAA